MPNLEYLCSHQIIDDEKEGCSVCILCGYVVEEKLFLPSYKDNKDKTCLKSESMSANKDEENEIRELLHRMNMPDSYSHKIMEKNKNSKKSIPYMIYKTLNQDGCPISIRDVSAVSGMTDSKIYKEQETDVVFISRPELMLEKYCKFFGLDFNSYTVIKKIIENSSKSGHNPLTIIGAQIYLHKKKANEKISMKLVAKELKISCISIQRYLKKY